MAPFQTPTVRELAERAVADVELELQTGPSPRRSLVRALSLALAGAAAGAHGHIAWVADQIMPDTADGEQLARWASIWGIGRKAGTPSSGSVGFSGTPGVSLPAGIVVQSGTHTYITQEDGLLDLSGEAWLEVVATESGSSGDVAGGTPINLHVAVPGVQTVAFVGGSGLVGGNDPEGDEALRTRLLAHLQTPPRGGTVGDYEAWALEVAGVTRAWALPNNQGLGTVGLTFMRDDDPDVQVVPTEAQVAAVQEYVDSKRPVGAQLVVFAPSVQVVPFELTVTPDTPVMRAAVEASLRDLLSRASEPGSEILVSHIHEAISTTPNERDHTLTAPAVNIQLAAGEIATLGEVTWPS